MRVGLPLNVYRKLNSTVIKMFFDKLISPIMSKLERGVFNMFKVNYTESFIYSYLLNLLDKILTFVDPGHPQCLLKTNAFMSIVGVNLGASRAVVPSIIKVRMTITFHKGATP